MVTSAADLACVNTDGSLVYPMGPCCAWPQSKNANKENIEEPANERIISRTKVKASIADMAKGIVETTVKVVRQGRIDQSSRDARYSQCMNCDSFIRQSKRCAECGCFMEAKTWVAGASCPLEKW